MSQSAKHSLSQNPNTTEPVKKVSKMEAFLRPKKFLAFGDSYVLMFMHARNATHFKFKGKSIKGLSKETDPDRLRIQKIVKEHKEGSLVFSFGQVDLNFIRYYKLAHKESYQMDTFQKYIEWIASLNRKSYIIGMLASPIKKQHIISTLLKYHILEEPLDEKKILKEFTKTQKRRQQCNTFLKELCDKKGLNFIELFQNDNLRPEFLDQNPKTIHLRYLPCILELKKHLQLDINIAKALQTEQKYVQEKTLRYKIQLDELQKKKQQSIDTQQTGEKSDSYKQQNLSSDEQMDFKVQL